MTAARELLAAALLDADYTAIDVATWRETVGDDALASYDAYLDALMPAVNQIANQRAAAELRAAADVASFTPLSQRESGTLTDFTEGWHAAAQFLRSRADELDGDR